MFQRQHRYSGLIVPLSYIQDLLVINLLIYQLPINLKSTLLFHTYISFAWILISIQTRFYKVNRFAKVPYLLRLLFNQFVFFFLVLYAFIGFFKQPIISRLALAEYFILVGLSVSALKLITHILLMRYRKYIRGNIRYVVVVGKNKKANQLIDVFQNRPQFGLMFLKQFETKKDKLNIEECFDYILENKVDEIYCSVTELSDSQMAKFINFADNNLIKLKFIPDNKNIFSKKLKFEYYEYIPVLSLRDIPLHNPLNAFAKRLFDIVFASLVVICLLSWLTPLLALIITLESKGPVFFRQKRNGIDNREFFCYKFRSMTPNDNADQASATKNDMRVTRVGKFIRRTSIDELPQFYNVFFGTMSVVGPRPHMVKHTNEFAFAVDKFMVRHFVKPGITGLAQVKGYRGEVENKSDILNRIKLDIFYVENWSMFLDFKIILQTVLNIFRKEEKAY